MAEGYDWDNTYLTFLRERIAANLRTTLMRTAALEVDNAVEAAIKDLAIAIKREIDPSRMAEVVRVLVKEHS